MYCLVWVDFYGTKEELAKLDKVYKEASEKTDGVEYLGRYSSYQAKWHWVYMFKTESMAKIEESWKHFDYDRDYKKMSHGIVEFLTGPA
jgi:hypothetical protein